ncbi:DeoR/GlpR family DNA-binding transcription regulator [Roseibium litorale]|uniref:DeoR/GlpR transcriptional regulator n=1 Tax=Roseibium litorale TaxID=2803841 RepID=A0ABR9CL10_9HYPH|nr:DeoR/GlpR family DNA-binding transcription regulator [Roseibium litorale]MBD8891012.1 DeoR/GlpR transcriptional regulator [Roseibium litorale]
MSDQKDSERRKQILHTLKTRPHARISELSDQFRVCSETIRQDLDDLGQMGLVPRGCSGILPETGAHRLYPDMDTRSAMRREERERIGAHAAKLVLPGSTVMMDAGTTTLQMARMLTIAETPCTVITNSLPIAMTLGQCRTSDVVLCPGDYLATEAAVSGAEALAFLERHTVDACFIGASAVDERGASEAVRPLAILKTVMLAAARTKYLLAGREKFGQRDLVHISALDEFNGLICDGDPDPEFGEVLNAAGLPVYTGTSPAIQNATG